jgi:hypothetical protein
MKTSTILIIMYVVFILFIILNWLNRSDDKK